MVRIQQVAGAVVATLLVVTSVVGPVALVEANTETTGRVQLGGSPVVSGTQYEYELQNVSAVRDLRGTLTGIETKEWDNVSATVTDGETLAVNPAGDEIRQQEVLFEGVVETTAKTETGTVSPGGSASVSVGGNIDPTNEELTLTAGDRETQRKSPYSASNYNEGKAPLTTTFSSPPDRLSKVAVQLSDYTWSSGQPDYSVYLITNGQNRSIATIDPDGGESRWANASYSGLKTGPDVTLKVTGGGDTAVYWEVAEIVGTTPKNVEVTASDGTTATFGDFTAGETKTRALSISTGVSSLDVTGTGGTLDWSFSREERTATEDPAADIDGDGTAEITHTGILLDGETASYDAPSLGLNDATTTVSTTSGSQVTTEVRLQEVSTTNDASVSLNGQQIASMSSLAPGETHNFSASASLLQNGTNTVNVSVGGLSADAPEPKVKLNYSHTAEKTLSIKKSNEALSQRIETNATFYTDQEDVTQRIDFGEGIVAVRSLEYCINGRDCQPLSSEQYRLENTTVIASIGDIQAGTTVTTRGVGSRIQVENASVQVTDPTLYGNSLDSKLALSNVEGPVSLAVDASDQRLRYAYDESWDAEETALVTADGDQRVRFPNAPSGGGTVRLTTMPLAVQPDHGDVAVHVEEASGNPMIDVRPGQRGGDKATFVYHRTTSGQQYKLRSVTHAEVYDTEIAQSPVTLEDDDSPETLKIIEEDPTKDDGGGGGGGPLKEVGRRLAGLFGAVAALAGVALLGSRVGGESSFTDEIVLVGGVLVVGIGSLAVIDPTFAATIGAGIGGGFRALGQSLGKASGPIAIVAIVSLAVLGWGYFKSRDTDIVVDGKKVNK